VPKAKPPLETVMTALTPFDTDPRAEARPPRPRCGFAGPIFTGYLILALFFLGFGGWAGHFALDSATVAQGTVVVDGNRKTVQHLEGGIVREILVRDGDRVAAGQVLVRLDQTQARTTLAMATSRYRTALATAARLTAEQNGLSKIVFPPELLSDKDDPEVAKLIAGQTALFAARRDEINSQIVVLRQRDAEIDEEIRGLEQQIAAQQTQMRLIREESRTVEELLTRGLAQKPRLLALARQEAEIAGASGRDVATIARARQTIGETQLRISELQNKRITDAVKDYADVLKEVFEFADRRAAAQDVLSRTEIRAPLDGVVMNQAVHTMGGVIAPGAAVMDIVPNTDRLVVNAKVDVSDIERVRAGLSAQVRLVTFNRRNTPTLDGTVAFVSADRIDDDKAHIAYYIARIEVDPGQLQRLDDVRLYPGMQVEAMIVSERRTLFDYLVAPFNRTFARALREY
jgi:membrane fusion protein, type I secretion system